MCSGPASPGRLKVLRAGIEPLVIASRRRDIVIAALRPDAVPSDVVCVLAAARRAGRDADQTQRIVAASCVVVACVRCSTSKAGYSASQRQSTSARAVAVDGGPGPVTLYEATVLSGAGQQNRVPCC